MKTADSRIRNYSAPERSAASQRPPPTHSSKERQVREGKPGRYHSMRSSAETRTSGSDSSRPSDIGRNPLRSSAFFVQRAKASSAALNRTAGASSCLLRNPPPIEKQTASPEIEIHPARKHQVFGRTAAKSLGTRKQPDPVGKPESLLDIVRRKQDRFMLQAGQTMKQLHDFDAARHIQKSSRLIEQNDGTLLSERLGDHRLLALPVG